jgi:hypothetical protein
MVCGGDEAKNKKTDRGHERNEDLKNPSLHFFLQTPYMLSGRFVMDFFKALMSPGL